MNIYLTKLNGVLVPSSEEDADRLKKIKEGVPVRVKLTKQRNPGFHRKWWALIGVAYDAWECRSKDPNEPPTKDKEGFRKDIIILTGRYTSYTRLNGETRLEAQSIAFDSMSQEDFEGLYSDAIKVILERILTRYTEEDLDTVVEHILSFDG